MYVSYTSIPTSTANTTMKSTKLLTNPYLDVTSTSTSAAASKLNKLIHDHNQSTTNNYHHFNHLQNNNNNTNSLHQHHYHPQNSMQNNTITTNTNTSNSNSNGKKKPRKPNANHTSSNCSNNEINTSITGLMGNGDEMGDKSTVQLHSMSFHSYKSGTNTDEFDDCTTTTTTTTATAATAATPIKHMTNPIRSHNNASHVHKSNGVIYRTPSNKRHSGNAYTPHRTTARYPDSDDTRSSSIDYNFNYVKFRSPLNAASAAINGKVAAFRDSSPTRITAANTALAFDSNTFGRPMASKCIENNADKRHSLILPKVHNHPNCQCSLKNYCPFAVAAAATAAAERIEKKTLATTPLNQSAGNGHERKCLSPRHLYRRRDLNNAFHYDGKLYESPPEYDRIDDFLMKRTHSHDRLFSQRRAGSTSAVATSAAAIRSSTRPKSYCSNVNHYPVQL